MRTPSATRHYLNHHLDSSRWQAYRPRPDDIIVTTSYKSGTTFTQQILYNLLVTSSLNDEVPPPVDKFSPWVDARHWPMTTEEMGQHLESIPHRRFLKSHLAFDGLPYYPEVKYLVIARDPRDVFMSLWNHYANYTAVAYARFNNNNPGEPLPRYERFHDGKAFWRSWIGQGWFEWEKEGYPFWGNMHHTQSYWDYAHLDNVLLLHYSDMRADLPGTIRTIADFIDHPLSEETLDLTVQAVSFNRVKAQAEQETLTEVPEERFFAGGSAAFINKGSNGRWKDFLDADDLALYEATKAKVLSPECAAWLEREPAD